MTDRELCDIIERVRVECSRHSDVTYALGGVYALDTVKPLLRERLRTEVSSPARPDLRELLEKAFEAGHWSWPTPNEPTRAMQRQKAVDALLAEGAASTAPPALEQLIEAWRRTQKAKKMGYVHRLETRRQSHRMR